MNSNFLNWRATRRVCLAAAAGAAGLLALGRAVAQEPKVMTIYFSHYGSCREAAEEVHRILGGDLARFETVKTYPQEYSRVYDIALAERDSNARPALKPGIPDLRGYDIICIGNPLWHGHLPMAYYTLLEQYRDLAGKTIVSFNTHGGTGRGASQHEIERLLPGCRVLDGLALYGWGGLRGKSEIRPWLERIGVAGKA